MTTFGFFLSSEEHTPGALVDQAIAAEEAGFTSVMISDHFHPWNDRQGQSPFVWSVIGAIAAKTKLQITTGVTCPTVRIHPAVMAHAAATSQLLCEGRFRLGLGSGERLNEHILGTHWPSVDVRLAMLEEAIAILRDMWKGKLYNHRGAHYVVENARIYSSPDVPPPILVSGFGPKAIETAARIGEGFITTKPLADHVSLYRNAGGQGHTVGTCKVCWAADEYEALRTALELWPTEALSGELSQELSMPRHFEEVASIVSQDMIAQEVPCGPDPDRHVNLIRRYFDAGFDELFITQIGPDTDGFFEFFKQELRPRLVP